MHTRRWIASYFLTSNSHGFHVMAKQEAAALAATQVAFVLQTGQRRGLQFAIAPGPPTMNTHQQEQV